MNKNAFDAVCFGEILWDLLPGGAKPGGAPMNVAYHLQKQGIRTAMISREGKDERGDELRKLLEANASDTGLVQVDGVHQTGIVNATIGANNEVSYDIVEPVAWDFIGWEPSLSEVVSGARFFIYGSLAARHSVSHRTLWQLIEAAQMRVVDINLRPPHFSKGLVETLLEDADIAKLNEHEVALISQWYVNLKLLEDQVRFLQDKFSIPLLVVTKGANGALACEEGIVTDHPGFPVTVADTVGSGDAFFAAFLYKTLEGVPVKERLEFANALGAFIASKEGACPRYELNEIALLLNQPISPRAS